jgi:uncharacterized protein YjbI with pentapeptide repeats
MRNSPNNSIIYLLQKLQEGRVNLENQSSIINELGAHRKKENNEKDVASEFKKALKKFIDKNKNNARINFPWSDLSEIEFKRDPQLSYDGSSFFGSTISTINKNLTNLSFQNTDFGFAKLSWVDLSGANLTGANLVKAVLDTANLTGANLTKANLTGADLTITNLTKANLTGVNLTKADLSRANLTKANLTGADLTGADLTGADLTGAKFEGVMQNTITLETIPDSNKLGIKTMLYLLQDGVLSDDQKKEMLGIGHEVPVSKYLQGLIEQTQYHEVKSDVKKVLEAVEVFENKIKPKKRSLSPDLQGSKSKKGKWVGLTENQANTPLDQSRF